MPTENLCTLHSILYILLSQYVQQYAIPNRPIGLVNLRLQMLILLSCIAKALFSCHSCFHYFQQMKVHNLREIKVCLEQCWERYLQTVSGLEKSCVEQFIGEGLGDWDWASLVITLYSDKINALPSCLIQLWRERSAVIPLGNQTLFFPSVHTFCANMLSFCSGVSIQVWKIIMILILCWCTDLPLNNTVDFVVVGWKKMFHRFQMHILSCPQQIKDV